MKYAVDCPACGLVRLTEREYDFQMDRPDSLWFCPKCGSYAEWDDDTYEENFGASLIMDAPAIPTHGDET